MNATATARDPIYGWVIVGIAAVCTGLGFGALTTAAVFLTPLANEFGWLRGEISFAYTVAALAAAICGLGVGYLAIHVATRVFTLVGVVFLGLALGTAGFIGALWQLHALYAIAGGLGFAALNAPITATASRWVPRSPGLAIGIITAGGAVGQGFVPLIAQFLISSMEWRDAYFVLGAGYLVIGIPLALLVREAPIPSIARQASQRSAEKALLLRSVVAMLWVGIAAIFCCICMSVPIMHVVALVTDRGLAPEVGAGVLTILMASGAVGRIVAGKLSDRIGGLRTYMLTSIGQASMVFWFVQVDSTLGFYLIAVAFGFAYAGVMTCLIIVMRELLPDRLFAMGITVVSMFGWIGMGIGAVQGGLLFDLTGNYVISYGSAAVAGYVNLLILFVLYRYLKALEKRKAALAVSAIAG